MRLAIERSSWDCMLHGLTGRAVSWQGVIISAQGTATGPAPMQTRNPLGDLPTSLPGLTQSLLLHALPSHFAAAQHRLPEPALGSRAATVVPFEEVSQRLHMVGRSGFRENCGSPPQPSRDGPSGHGPDRAGVTTSSGSPGREWGGKSRPGPGIAHPIAVFVTSGSNAESALGTVAVSHRFVRRCRGFSRKDRHVRAGWHPKTAIPARRRQQRRGITQVLKVVLVSPVTDRRF
jgi:hypothetical protein